MSAYVPSLTIEPRTQITRTRLLPVLGKVLVSAGQKVAADTTVLVAALPGDLEIIRIAERLDLEPEDVIPGIKVQKNTHVEKGDLLCSTKYFFGLFSAELRAREAGQIEFINKTNGHLGLRLPPRPIQMEAYIPGVISEVKEGSAVSITCTGALMQGIFGVGGERRGELKVLDVPRDKQVSASDLNGVELNGKILVGGSSISLDAIELCRQSGVAGVITGSIDAETLKSYVGYDIGVSITGDEDVPFTLIITEGFGSLEMSERYYTLAKALEGKPASLNGATQIRAGATRPELIVASEETDSQSPTATLEPGARVRIIRVPYFGMFGEVVELPSAPEEIPSGAVVRVLRAKLENGEVVTVPRANVELT